MAHPYFFKDALRGVVLRVMGCIDSVWLKGIETKSYDFSCCLRSEPAAPARTANSIMPAGRRPLWEAHFGVGTLFEMHGVDEAHLPLVQRDDQRLRADAIAEETHAAQQVSLGHSRACEDNFIP